MSPKLVARTIGSLYRAYQESRGQGYDIEVLPQAHHTGQNQEPSR